MATRKGLDLSWKLAKSTGWNSNLAELCSLLCRAATTHHRLSEENCNGPAWIDNERIATSARIDRWQAELDKKIERTEKRIHNIVKELPLVDGQPITALLNGDPRSATVKLIMPDGRYDDWGHEGICVPGS